LVVVLLAALLFALVGLVGMLASPSTSTLVLVPAAGGLVSLVLAVALLWAPEPKVSA
jgi:hypothetical protein